MITYYEEEDDDEFEHELDFTTTDLDVAELIEDEEAIHVILSGLDNDHEDIFRFSKS